MELCYRGREGEEEVNEWSSWPPSGSFWSSEALLFEPSSWGQYFFLVISRGPLSVAGVRGLLKTRLSAEGGTDLLAPAHLGLRLNPICVARIPAAPFAVAIEPFY